MGLVATARANMPADQIKKAMETWSCKPEEDYTERDSKETQGDQWDNFCVFVFLKKTHSNTKKKHFRGAGRHANKGKVLNKAGEEEKVLYVSCEL
jgi:hypothetical protein